ncbi:MAG: rhodanese-like domain-containing protein [Spirochaetales bacterium]|nr:rhodanese-like domain-containing protein [Spirochaetales bacterium]
MNTLIPILLAAFVLYKLLYPVLSGQLSYKNFKELLSSDQPPVILDVRTASEYKSGHIEGARNIPYDKLPKGLGKKIAGKDSSIVVYCHSGSRSGAASRALKSAGYSNVQNFGAISRWKEPLKC